VLSSLLAKGFTKEKQSMYDGTEVFSTCRGKSGDSCMMVFSATDFFPVCYQAECDASLQQIILLVSRGSTDQNLSSQRVVCADQQTSATVDGWSGEILCPDFDTYCAESQPSSHKISAMPAQLHESTNGDTPGGLLIMKEGFPELVFTGICLKQIK
jgi:hypothetical protein